MEPAERKNIFIIGISLLAMLAVAVALQFAAVALFTDSINSSWGVYAVTLIPQYFIAMPLAYLIMRTVQKGGIAKKRLSAVQILQAALVCFAIMYAGSLAAQAIASVIGEIADAKVTNVVAELIGSSDILSSFAAMGLIAPVIEELFYRKLLIGRLIRYGDKPAIITSALVFALLHGNVYQLFYAFGLGAALGYVYVRTGNIAYTIGLHMFINIMGGVVAPLMLLSKDVIMLTLYGLLMLGIVIAGIVVCTTNRRRIRYEKGAVELESWKKAIFLNEGMALFFVTCAALFVYNTIVTLQ